MKSFSPTYGTKKEVEAALGYQALERNKAALGI